MGCIEHDLVLSGLLVTVGENGDFPSKNVYHYQANVPLVSYLIDGKRRVERSRFREYKEMMKERQLKTRPRFISESNRSAP